MESGGRKLKRIIALNLGLTVLILAVMVYLAVTANTIWKTLQVKAAAFGIKL